MLACETADANPPQYGVMAESGSMMNTPPTFGVYVLGLVVKWVLKEGGVEEMERRGKERSARVYKVVEESSLYEAVVKEPRVQSRVNIPFRLKERERVMREGWNRSSIPAGSR